MRQASEQISASQPKVSVAMITYNHGPFIAQAIESVLMQENNFQIELVIGEDCSTDGTRDVVKKFAESRPDVIRLLLHTPNVGMHKNTQAVLDACRGEYVAFLEGDDFWTAKDKLQKQVDFLDGHPDYVMAFHRVRTFRDSPGWEFEHLHPGDSCCERHTLETLLRQGNPVPTCSVVARREHLQPLPANCAHLAMTDFPRWLLLARFGDARYFNDVMGAYRVGGGAWASKPRHEQYLAGASMFDAIQEHLPSAARQLAAQCAANEHAKAKRELRQFERTGRLREIQAAPNRRQRLGRIFGAVVRMPSIVAWGPFLSVAAETMFGKRIKSALGQTMFKAGGHNGDAGEA
jgi:hypothetical protein